MLFTFLASTPFIQQNKSLRTLLAFSKFNIITSLRIRPLTGEVLSSMNVSLLNR